jgi:predicted amidohydrolase YtcJ
MLDSVKAAAHLRTTDPTMQIKPLHYALLLLLLLLTACDRGESVAEATSPTAGADLILINGDIYTVDQGIPRAEAFAVTDGRFALIGNNADVRTVAGENTTVLDAAGATVTPGFIDGHTHIDAGVALITGVDLTDIVDKQEWLEEIAAAVANLAEEQWLLGGAWNHLLSDGVLPSKEMLDEVAPDNPVLLWDIDHHSAWVNSKALALTGITAETPVPPGGHIILNESGEPNGILLEAAGMMLEERPDITAAMTKIDGLASTTAFINSLGITGVHDMSLRPETLESFMQIMEDDRLTLRMWNGSIAYGADDIAALVQRRESVRARIEHHRNTLTADPGPLYAMGYVKTLVDGVFSTRTALLSAPYSDLPDTVVQPWSTPEQMIPLIRAANKADFAVSIHAIGDQGVSDVLDSYAAVSERASHPNRMEHLELVAADDLLRLKALNVVASMQPLHFSCCVGLYVIDRVGEQRLREQGFLWQPMLEHGIDLVLGSDWPTASMDPLKQLDGAQKRTTTIDGVIKQWNDGKHALTFEQALYGYTQAPANITPWKNEIGSISVGKRADFVILDKTVARSGIRDLSQVSVSTTYFNGKPVYTKAPSVTED